VLPALRPFGKPFDKPFDRLRGASGGTKLRGGQAQGSLRAWLRQAQDARQHGTYHFPDPATFLKLLIEDTALAVGQVDAVFVGLAHRCIVAQAYRNSKFVRTFSASVGGALPECMSPPCAARPFIRRLKSAVFWRTARNSSPSTNYSQQAAKSQQ